MNEKDLKLPKFYSSVIVMNSAGQVLLGERKDGIVTPPGGHAEDHETPTQAGVRELFEEAAFIAKEHELQELPTITTTNGRICHCYLLVTGQHVASSRLDPDKEVKEWKWYHEHDLPKGLDKDPRRFESVRNAFMKFHGITKGGLGSGPKPGKITKQPWDDSVKDTPEYDARLAQRKADKIKRQLDQAKLEYKLKFGKDYESVKKGGEGSGVKGHQTFNATQNNVSNLASKLADPDPFKSHLSKLTTAPILEGEELKSGKPVYNNIDQAMAHGYTAEDYTEAANIHYEKMMSIDNQIKKIKMLKHPVPPEMNKILKFHEQQFKQQHNMAKVVNKRHAQTGKVLDRQKKVSEATREADKFIAEKKAKESQDFKYSSKVKKSVVMMGQQDAAEVDTGKFAQEHYKDLSGWIEHISNVMNGYNYGDTPREVSIDKGTLYLTKVDDGMYSGFVKLMGPEMMEDNAKVRIERMTVPSLAQFMLAKEYILPGPSIAGNGPGNNNMATGGEMTLAQPPTFESLNESLMLEPFSESMPEPSLPKVESVSMIDKKIMMLQLIDKLMS